MPGALNGPEKFRMLQSLLQVLLKVRGGGSLKPSMNVLTLSVPLRQDSFDSDK